jgi:hypothetical protein
MILILENNVHSTQPLYEMCYVINKDKNMGYTSEPITYEPLKETELNLMSISYAQKSFVEDWDISDIEENEYWNSFVG